MQPQQQPETAHRRGASSACSTAPRRGIGCMAGLLRLISPYHRSHHRKRLTAKHNATAQASAAPSQPSSPTKKKVVAAVVAPSSPAPPSPVKATLQQAPAAFRRRRSCDAPRSPTIAPEHRRSSCDSPRPPPPAIVARLMGLEESAPPSPAVAAAEPRPVVVPTRPPPPPPAPETAAEKRRKLLGALEKCDEDLKTLRRIIAAVRAAEMRAAAASDAAPAAAASPPAGSKCAAKWMVSRDENSPSPSPSPPTSTPQHHKPRAGEQQQQHPSPDSVLDAISSPRFPCRKRPSPCTEHDAGGKQAGCGATAPTAVRSKIVKPSRTLVFTGDYCKTKSSDESTLQLHAVGYPVVPLVVGMPRAAGAESWRHHRRRWELEAAAAGRVISRAMAESVGAEAMWGPPPQGSDDEQRRERGRVAAALERAVVEDLVAELLADLLAMSGRGHGGGGCRKRLCF